jgi:hypothetical protein
VLWIVDSPIIGNKEKQIEIKLAELGLVFDFSEKNQ